jgi:hypothetical protein
MRVIPWNSRYMEGVIFEFLYTAGRDRLPSIFLMTSIISSNVLDLFGF